MLDQIKSVVLFRHVFGMVFRLFLCITTTFCKDVHVHLSSKICWHKTLYRHSWFPEDDSCWMWWLHDVPLAPPCGFDENISDFHDLLSDLHIPLRMNCNLWWSFNPSSSRIQHFLTKYLNYHQPSLYFVFLCLRAKLWWWSWWWSWVAWLWTLSSVWRGGSKRTAQSILILNSLPHKWKCLLTSCSLMRIFGCSQSVC